jgi:tryptophanase
VATAGAVPLDLAAPGTWDVDDELPFNGDIELLALEAFLSRRASEVAFVCLTALNNLGYSQPVSMANIAAASEPARRSGVALFLDAARCAENAYSIKRRENGYGERSVEQIVREMFSHADGY